MTRPLWFVPNMNFPFAVYHRFSFLVLIEDAEICFRLVILTGLNPIRSNLADMRRATIDHHRVIRRRSLGVMGFTAAGQAIAKAVTHIGIGMGFIRLF